MALSKMVIDLCSDDEDNSASSTISYEEYLATRNIDCSVKDEIYTIWEKIADIKEIIELTLIKQSAISHFTPLGGFAKLSEFHSSKRFNQSTMTGHYRIVFQEMNDESKGICERLSIASAMSASIRKQRENVVIQKHMKTVDDFISKINKLAPHLQIPEMRTVIHTVQKATQKKQKQYEGRICEFCSDIKIFKNSAEIARHVAREHSHHFGKAVEEFYSYADMLTDKKIQLALEKMKHLLIGQESFVVFLSPELKAMVDNFVAEIGKTENATSKRKSDSSSEVVIPAKTRNLAQGTCTTATISPYPPFCSTGSSNLPSEQSATSGQSPSAHYSHADYYQKKLEKQQEMILHYQDRERERLEKEKEELEKQKQEFQLHCAREREMLAIEKTLATKESTPQFLNRYRNHPSATSSSTNENNQILKMEAAKKCNRFPNQFFIGDNVKFNRFLRDSVEQKDFPYYWVDTLGQIRCHCPERPLAVYLKNNCHIKCAKKSRLLGKCTLFLPNYP